MNPEIRKTLVCSTAHLTKNVARVLDTGSLECCTHDTVEYGYLVRHWWSADHPADRMDAWRVMPRCLKDVIYRAEREGCSMVLFDCDGFIIDGLKTYHW